MAGVTNLRVAEAVNRRGEPAIASRPAVHCRIIISNLTMPLVASAAGPIFHHDGVALTIPTTSTAGTASWVTILVVDDDAAVREVVSRVLRAAGYHVLEASNGEHALVVAGEHAAPIHLVVADVVMPEMDGRTLYDHMHTWYPSIRFLFISGYTRGFLTSDQIDQSPLVAFMPKPFGADDVIAQVQELLAKAGPQPRRAARRL